jgi:hypothetical protein
MVVMPGKPVARLMPGTTKQAQSAKPSFRLRDFPGVVKKVGENLIFAASPIEIRV